MSSFSQQNGCVAQELINFVHNLYYRFLVLNTTKMTHVEHANANYRKVFPIIHPIFMVFCPRIRLHA